MNLQLQSKCEQLVQNRNELNRIFSLELGEMNLASALILTGEDKLANKKECKEVEKLLHDKTGILSDFRGNVRLPLICKMLSSEDPSAYFEKVKKVYEILRKSKWLGNDYKILAAITICDHTNEQDYQKYIDRTESIFAKMKENHKWITNDEDIPFAAMLSVSDLDVDALTEETEKCYALLKKKFGGNDVVQSLSHVLALGEQSAEEKCEKVFEIHRILREKKHKFGIGNELSVLGALAVCKPTAEEIADMIIEADDFLKEKRGFGNFSLGATQRRMYAAQVCLECLNGEKDAGRAVALAGAVTAVVAAEIAILLCVSACIIVSTSD